MHGSEKVRTAVHHRNATSGQRSWSRRREHRLAAMPQPRLSPRLHGTSAAVDGNASRRPRRCRRSAPHDAVATRWVTSSRLLSSLQRTVTLASVHHIANGRACALFVQDTGVRDVGARPVAGCPADPTAGSVSRWSEASLLWIAFWVMGLRVSTGSRTPAVRLFIAEQIGWPNSPFSSRWPMPISL